MNSTPLLSVAMVTYNHEKYITQAIESTLMQHTDFDFEIVIGEDCSEDGTRAIVEHFAMKYPDKIHVLLHPSNLGFGGRINSINTLKACRGKYIAILEGDDFWTDKLKLQKQVNFFESNPDFSICFHNARIIYEDAPNKFAFSNPVDQQEISTFDDLAKGEFIYTATAMFRRIDFNKLPEKYLKYLNNYTLDLHNAQYGKIKYMNEVMSVYRMHKGGTWSMVEREKTLIAQLPVYKFYLNYFKKKYRKEFKKHLKAMTSELVAIKMEKDELKNFWRYYFDYILYNINEMGEFRHMASIFYKINKRKIEKLLSKNI